MKTAKINVGSGKGGSQIESETDGDAIRSFAVQGERYMQIYYECSREDLKEYCLQ